MTGISRVSMFVNVRCHILENIYLSVSKHYMYGMCAYLRGMPYISVTYQSESVIFMMRIQLHMMIDQGVRHSSRRDLKCIRTFIRSKISAQSLDKCHDKCLLEDLHALP